MAHKQATAFVVNLASSPSIEDFNHIKEVLTSLLQGKILAGRKTDECTIIGVGTQQTKNELAKCSGDEESYRNVSVLMDMGAPQAEQLRMVHNLQPTSYDADVLDGVVVAFDLINRHTAGKKFEKRMFVVTGDKQPVLDDGVEQIAHSFVVNEIELDIISVGFTLPEMQLDSANHTLKALETLRAGARGFVTPLDVAHRDLAKFAGISRAKPRSIPTYRGPLFLGPGIPVDVRVLLNVSRAVAPRAVRISAPALDLLPESQRSNPPAGSADVMSERVFRKVKERDTSNTEERNPVDVGDEGSDEEAGELVDEANVIKAYKYADVYVPLLPHEDKFKPNLERQFRVLFYVPRERLPPQYWTGRSMYRVVSEDIESPGGRVFAQFVNTLLVGNELGVCVLVTRSEIMPKIMALIPQRTAAGALIFHLAVIPYQNDLKPSTFPPLKEDTNRKSSLERRKAFRAVMDSMSFSDGMGPYHPECIYNPLISRLNRSILDRLMDRQSQLRDFEAVEKDQFRHYGLGDPNGEMALASLKRVLDKTVRKVEVSSNRRERPVASG